MKSGLTILWLCVTAVSAWAQDPSDAIYDDGQIRTFRLTMNGADWDAICNDGAGSGDIWKRADMTWEGEAVPGVGVKRSGMGTRTMDTPKPSIRISFNEFEFSNPAGPGTPGRKWRGVNRIKLDSMIGNTDHAMMRDRVAYWVFRSSGAPAPRLAHCRLYVNGAFKGLYCAEEPVRKDFVRYRWNEDSGNLYNQNGWGTDAYNWRGTSPGSYVPNPFEADTNYPGGDYTDLVQLMNILNNYPAAEIRGRLDGHTNLDGVVRHFAMTTVTGDNDDISHWGGGWCNNHYWYHRAGTNRMELIKWDPGASQGMYEASMGIAKGQSALGYKYENVKMTAWSKNDSTAWNLYKTKVQQILDGPGASVLSRIDSISAQIRSHVYEDTLKGKSSNDADGFTNSEHDAGVVWLKDWWSKRLSYLRGQVGSTTPTNNAAFVSQTVPSTMTAGQTYTVSVTMKNTGTTTWNDVSYRLGSQNPMDNTTWGANRQPLDPGETVAPGAQTTFSWTLTAPAAGTYNFQWQMRQSGVEWFGPLTPNVVVTVSATTPPPPPPPTTTNGASFVSQTVPSTMTTGQNYTVSVTMKNTGTSTWVDTSYRLGSQNPQDNTTWGSNRISMSAGESIAPGQQKTFSWTVAAPTTAGTYNFQWQMRQSGVEWFGPLTPNVAVVVSSPTGPPPAGTNASSYVSQSVPANMIAGQTYAVSVTFRNTGTATWTDSAGYRLSSRHPRDNSTWGRNRVFLGSTDTVAPNATYTFRFNVTAPSAPGTYDFTWSMMQEGVGVFDPTSQTVMVAVAAAAVAPAVAAWDPDNANGNASLNDRCHTSVAGGALPAWVGGLALLGLLLLRRR